MIASGLALLRIGSEWTAAHHDLHTFPLAVTGVEARSLKAGQRFGDSCSRTLAIQLSTAVTSSNQAYALTAPSPNGRGTTMTSWLTVLVRWARAFHSRAG